MKCPHCGSEIADLSQSCVFCGKAITIADTAQSYTAPQTGSAASAPSQPQQQTQNAGYRSTANTYSYGNGRYAAPAYGAQPAGAYLPSANQGKSGGEIAAIVSAIVVSVLSFILAFIIFAFYVARAAKNMPDITNYGGDSSGFDFGDFGDFGDYDFDDPDGYGIDGFDDEDSLENFLEYYGSLFGTQKAAHPASDPAAEHMPVEFSDTLYSGTAGFISCKFQVELDEVYRGEAALKLLEGARLPEIADNMEIYLVKYKLNITEQETEAFVNLAPDKLFAAAYSAEEKDGVLTTGRQYVTLSNVSYKDANQLIAKGDDAYGWIAFAVDKTEERPLIMWNKYNKEYFRYSTQAISDPTGLEAGAAFDPEDTVSSGL